MNIDHALGIDSLLPAVKSVMTAGAAKACALERSWDPARGTPVFTVEGRYTTRGWTEWTQGFQYGCLLLAGDGLGNDDLVARGRRLVETRMLPHVTHTGVHDHGFNNISTYGNLLRLAAEGRWQAAPADIARYRDLLAVSGAVQAARWAETSDGGGYICSFNGPHSLFIDTLRSLRSLAVAHRLGHFLMTENDRRVNLLERLVRHALTTDRHLVFHGDSDHGYDVRGRTAHEGVFNRADGTFRSRATQQGYSPFSTWTRGLAWAILAFAEQLEFLATVADDELRVAAGGLAPRAVRARFRRAAIDTADHYIADVTAADGVPFWDDGAPGLHRLGDWRSRPADPFNDHEPVDSSAAAIAAQGLLRLGRHLDGARGRRYTQAGLTVARTLMGPPYLDVTRRHQGLLLHSVYHWPNRWDHVPPGRKITCGEAGLWGDYHLLELAILIQRLAGGGPYPSFFSGV